MEFETSDNGAKAARTPFVPRSGLLHWGAILDINPKKCNSEGFVDSLQLVVDNVARSDIRADLRFSQVSAATLDSLGTTFSTLLY